MYSIQDNYSVLNNYNYENKASLTTVLDALSKPCRKVLGGRDVCVISQTYENKMSTARKVITVFFSVLIFPVAFISIASLILKLATFHCIWERKKVVVQSQQAWNVINQFNQAFENNEYGKAIQIIREKPQFVERNDVYDNFFLSINRKINNQCSWKEIEDALPLLKTTDAMNLIDHAVAKRLLQEFNDDCIVTSAKDIISFIKHALRGHRRVNIEECYKKLFSNALQVDVNDHVLLNARKMEIADHLIRSYIQTSRAQAKNELERVNTRVMEMSLRYTIFEKQQDYVNYYLIFSSSKDMKKLCDVTENILLINKIKVNYNNKINVLLQQSYCNKEEQWKSIRPEFINMIDDLDKLLTLSGENEKAYIRSIKMTFDNMIKFADAFYITKTSAQEIESCGKNMQDGFNEQTRNLTSLSIDDTRGSDFQTNLIKVLNLKKKEVLTDFTQKMQSFFSDQMLCPELNAPIATV